MRKRLREFWVRLRVLHWVSLGLALSPLSASEVPRLLETPGAYGDFRLLNRSNDDLRLLGTRNGILVTKAFLSANPLAETRPAVHAMWLGVCVPADTDDIVAVVASFSDRRLRVYRIDVQNNAELLSVIEEQDGALRIDPTLLLVDGTYFVTATEIVGSVNNRDPAVENGTYTVRLYSSTDLVSWSDVGVVISAPNNLEDGSLFSDGFSGRLFFLCERETLDRGPSRIVVSRSDDYGKTWSVVGNLLDDGADNEPASARIVGDELQLFYSSDRRRPGSSYAGADVYFARFQIDSFRLKSEVVFDEAGPGLLVLSGAVLSDGQAAIAGIRSYFHNPTLVEARVTVPGM